MEGMLFSARAPALAVSGANHNSLGGWHCLRPALFACGTRRYQGPGWGEAPVREARITQPCEICADRVVPACAAQSPDESKPLRLRLQVVQTTVLQ